MSQQAVIAAIGSDTDVHSVWSLVANASFFGAFWFDEEDTTHVSSLWSDWKYRTSLTSKEMSLFSLFTSPSTKSIWDSVSCGLSHVGMGSPMNVDQAARFCKAKPVATSSALRLDSPDSESNTASPILMSLTSLPNL
eukprot:5454690-Amphidinium_carterae.1